MKRKIQAVILLFVLFFALPCYAEATSLREYRNTEYGYSIMVPDSFQINEQIQFPMIFHANDAVALLKISMLEMPDAVTTDGDLERTIFDAAAKAAAAWNGEVTVQKRTTLNNHDAFLTLFGFERNGNQYVCIMESAAAGKTLYHIVAISPLRREYAQLLPQSISSFRW